MLIAVDFDGTIVEHAYPAIGKPIPFAIDVLKKLQEEEHHQIVLWTVREGHLLDEAVRYCEKKGLKFYAVNQNFPEEPYDNKSPRKLNADLYIDDKNIGGLPDWGIIYQMIKSGSNDIREFEELLSHSQPRRKKNFFIRLGESLEARSSHRY
jgi:hypothetical protein